MICKHNFQVVASSPIEAVHLHPKNLKEAIVQKEPMEQHTNVANSTIFHLLVVLWDALSRFSMPVAKM